MDYFENFQSYTDVGVEVVEQLKRAKLGFFENADAAERSEFDLEDKTLAAFYEQLAKNYRDECKILMENEVRRQFDIALCN